MVSAYVAEIAIALGYDVVVCDPRPDRLAEFSVAGVRKAGDMPDDAVRRYASDSHSAVVALTHDPRIDDMGLMEALKTDAFYVGAMGSDRTSANRLERLKQLDLSDMEIRRLHAPIGLPIGSKTPPGDRRRRACRDHRGAQAVAPPKRVPPSRASPQAGDCRRRSRGR